MSIKPASTTCFYWTGFSEYSYNPVLSVCEHECKCPKTIVFRLGYTYPEGTQRLSSSISMENFKGINVYIHNSHKYTFQNWSARKSACALSSATILSKQSSNLKFYQMHLPGMETSLEHSTDKGTTIERLTPERVPREQSSNSFRTTGGSSACFFIWEQLRASCCASSLLGVKWLPKRYVFTHLLKLKNEVRLSPNVWFRWLVFQWWLLDYIANINIYLLQLFKPRLEICRWQL